MEKHCGLTRVEEAKVIGEAGTEAGVRAAVALIPGIGPALADLVFGAMQGRKIRRLELTCEALSARMSRVPEEIVDREFLKTDEFADIAEECLQRAATTANAARASAYREVLVGASLRGRPPYDEVQLYLARLPFLSEEHFAVLRAFEESDVKAFKFSQVAERLPGSGAALLDLTNLGLTHRANQNFFGSKEVRRAVEPYPDEQFSLTEFGERFIRFILGSG